MSLRARVAVVAGSVAAAAVLLAGLTVVTFTARDLHRAVDTRLRVASARLQGPLGDVVVRRPALADRLASLVPRDVGVVVHDGDGTTVVGGAPATAPAPDVGARPTTVELDGSPWRVLRVEPSPVAGVVVQVTAPLRDTDGAVGALRRRVWVITAVAGAGAAAAGWLLGAQVAGPLRRLRQQAADIATSADLTRRVGTEGSPAEVAELTDALNTMMGRLQQSAAETTASLEASRAFASNVSHELRTPLTSMQADLDVLGRHPELVEAERAAIVGGLQAQQARLLAMLDALRLLGRGELSGGEPWQEVDLADVAARAVQDHARRHPSAVLTFTAEGDTTVWGWPEGLAVLVSNLVGNAVVHGATPDGGAQVAVAARAGPDGVALVVSDHGPGVAPAERARIFERFQRGATAAPGTGLGLALVAQQAALHGGSVAVGETPGGGATFRVVLARRPRPPAWPPGAPGP